MNYIFCPSYASVFFALYLKNSGRKIKIVTDNISVKKYCRTADIECIYFDYIGVPIARFYKIFILKHRIKNLIKKINIERDDNFYLLDNTFCYDGFYLAKEWSKKGNVYFIYNLIEFPKNYIKDRYLNLNFLEKTTLIYLFKIFLGIDLILFEVNCRPIFGFNDKFLERHEIKKITLNKDLRELQLDAMRKSRIKQKECGNLIITDGSVWGIVKEESVKKMYKNLLKLPYKFAVKHHPYVIKLEKSGNVFKELFINCEEFPDYIPVELVFNNVKKNVISILSSSLIAASQLEHIKSISLLELVEWNNLSYKKEFKDFLIEESNNRITFVESFEELNTLLED